MEELDELPRLSLQSWISRYAVRRAHHAACVVFPEGHRAEYYLVWAHDARPACIVPNFPSLAAWHGPEAWTASPEQRWDTRQIIYQGAIGHTHAMIEAIAALARLDGGETLKYFGHIGVDERREMMSSVSAWGLEHRFVCDGVVPYPALMPHTSAASVGLALHKATSLNWEFLAGEERVIYVSPEAPVSVAGGIRRIFHDRDGYIAMSLAARKAFEQRFHYERAFLPVPDRIDSLVRGPKIERTG